MSLQKVFRRSRLLESLQKYAMPGQKRRVKFSTTVSPETVAWFQAVWEHERLSRGRLIDALVVIAQRGE